MKFGKVASVTKKDNRYYGAKKRQMPFSLILLICLAVCIVSTTVAYFFASDWAGKYTTMSGKVDIEAVSSTGSSIEDRVDGDVTISNLKVSLEDNYKFLISGMDIKMPAYVKVYQSTTKPLLRAKFSLKLYKTTTGGDVLLEGTSDPKNISTQMTSSIHSVIETNGWVLNDDGYYYYIKGSTIQDPVSNTIMYEVDATAGNVIEPFVKDTDLIKFPEDIDASYSGLKIKFSVTFEAIQNYIPNPDDDGKTNLPNTIANSKRIFDDGDEIGGGGASLTEEEIFQIYLDALNNMSTTPTGGYVANSIGFGFQNGYSEGEKITSAYNGNSYDSLYFILEDSPTTSYVEYDPYSDAVIYWYPKKVDNKYVVKYVNGGELYQDDEVTVNDLATAVSDQYSSVVEAIKKDSFGLSGSTSFSGFYEEIKLVFLEDYGFSEQVVDANVNYTLDKSGGVYNFVVSGDCAEYIDGTWTRLKMSATVKFNGTMVYKSSFEQLEQVGTLPSDITEEYRVVEDYAIEGYSTKYKPDISDIEIPEEYNEILKSAYAKMNANNGFVLKDYTWISWTGEGDVDSGAFGRISAYDGTNKESAYSVEKYLDVVDYTDWSKGVLDFYYAFGYEDGSLYYYNSDNKSIATDSNKEKVASDQIEKFNSALSTIGDYIGETGGDTVTNLRDALVSFGVSESEIVASYTKNGDTYKISVTGTVEGVRWECAIEFTEDAITKYYFKIEQNYPDKENGAWHYSGYDFEAYSTTYKPI